MQTALDQLSSDDNVDLYVVYVDTFDDPSTAIDWAAQTCAAVGPGQNQMLLAIATGGRAYAVQRADNFALSDAASCSRSRPRRSSPQLRNDDWAGAAIAAANGYRDALRRLLVGLVVGRRRASSSSAAGGYLIYRRRRRKADRCGRAGRSRSAPTGQPVDHRNRWTSCPPAACRR